KTQGLAVRLVADSVAQDNKVFQKSANVHLNTHNAQDGEVVIGEMIRVGGVASIQLGDPAQYNSVTVRVLQTADRNGELPLFFGHVLRTSQFSAEAMAQAVFIKDFK